MQENHTANHEQGLTMLAAMLKVESDFIEMEREDHSGIATVFHPEIKLQEPSSLPYAGLWEGHTGIGRLFKAMRDTWASLRGEDLRVFMVEDILFMFCTMIGQPRGSDQEIRQPFAQVLRIRDGLIIECTPFYFDTAAINSVLQTGS